MSEVIKQDLKTEALKLALDAIEKLWNIIDDIDTYGDMAKADEKLYRSLVERRQRTRFEETGISTDGHTLNGGAITAIREALAEPDYKALYEKAAQQYNELAELMENAQGDLERVKLVQTGVGIGKPEQDYLAGVPPMLPQMRDGEKIVVAQPEQEPEFITHSVEQPYDWSDWVCPDPKGYLMKCCDCGLVHEAQFGVVRYKSETEREDCDMVDDPNLQAVFRMRRSEQWSPEDMAHRAGGLTMVEQPYPDNFIDALKYDVARRDSETAQKDYWQEEIDILWNKVLRQSVDDGSLYTRYRFAELVAKHTLANIDPSSFMSWQEGYAAGVAAEREAKEELLDALQDLLMDTQHSEHECEDKNCPVANAKNVALKHSAIRARGETK